MKNSVFYDFIKGIWKENPVLVLLLGTCPTLALTGSAVNGLGMGIATTCVLAGSNFVISLIAAITPKKNPYSCIYRCYSFVCYGC